MRRPAIVIAVIAVGIGGCGKLLGLSEPEEPEPPRAIPTDAGLDASVDGSLDGGGSAEGSVDGPRPLYWECRAGDNPSYDTQDSCDQSRPLCDAIFADAGCIKENASAIYCPSTTCRDNAEGKWWFDVPRMDCVCR